MVTSVSSRIVVEIRREPHGSDLGRYGETRDRRDAGARGHAHHGRGGRGAHARSHHSQGQARRSCDMAMLIFMSGFALRAARGSSYRIRVQIHVVVHSIFHIV